MVYLPRFTVFVAFLYRAAAVSLPANTGLFSVGTFSVPLTDTSRIDPSAPSPVPRSIIVQLYYPTLSSHLPLSPYMPPLTAARYERTFDLPTGSLSNITTNSHVSPPLIPTLLIPTVLFSHGYTASRSMYAALLEDLASHGYLIIAIDHPYDASIVELPSGPVYAPTNRNLSDIAAFATLFDTRVKDVQFVVSLLSNLTTSIPGASRFLRISSLSMFGHSFGGATTGGAMASLPEIAGGMTLDGEIIGKAAQEGFDRPFVIAGVERHRLGNTASFQGFWAKLTGWKRALWIKAAEHVTFGDPGLWYSLLGVEMTTRMRGLLGTIDSVRGLQIQRVLVREFLQYVRGWGEGVYEDGESEAWPEVVWEV